MDKDPLFSDILWQLWLDDSEIKVFSTCYQHGSLSVASLARILWISRSTVHGIVSRLEANAFLISNHYSTTTLYDAISYTQLVHLVEAKQKNYISLLWDLEKQKEYLKWLYQTRVSQSIITYYSAQELNTLMYDKILLASHVKSIWDIDWWKKVFGLDSRQIMKLPRISTGITQRILADSPLARKYITLHQSDKYQLKLLPEGQGSKADLMIMEWSVYHWSYADKKQWFQVTESVFYQTAVVMFDALRNSLKYPK